MTPLPPILSVDKKTFVAGLLMQDELAHSRQILAPERPFVVSCYSKRDQLDPWFARRGASFLKAEDAVL